MSRLTYGAQQLIQQVQAEKPKATYETTDNPDGFNVHRGIKFDKRTSKWLAPLMEEFADDDPRIAGFEVTEAGYLHVDFVTTTAADDRTPYPLAEARAVHTVNEGSEESASDE